MTSKPELPPDIAAILLKAAEALNEGGLEVVLDFWTTLAWIKPSRFCCRRADRVRHVN